MKTVSFPHRAGHRGLIPIRPADRARSTRARRLDAIFRAASQCVEVLESRTLLSSVSGTVYNDLNLSGSRNTSDPGLAGIQVFDDLNDTGQYQTGDPSAVTASDGSYKIYHVPLNTPQVICVVPPTGWDASPADDGATSVTLTSAAPRVSEIDLGLWQPIESLSVQDIDLNEGQAFTGSVATVTDSAGGYANPYDYSGTLTLNGTSAVGFELDSDGNLVGQPANFPNLSAGTYGATVDVTESDNGRSFNDSAQFTVTINEVPISAQGVTSSAQTGIAWSGTIATFTDPDPNAQVSNYTATIDYGDGDEASVGTISSDGNGGWLVTDTHTFTSDGNFAPVVTIDDLAAGNDVAVATSAIAVTLAPISLNTQDIEFEEVNSSWNSIVGDLADSAGAYATGNYSGTLTINGSTCTNMSFLVLGNGSYSIQSNDFPVLSPGSYSATLNVTETGQVSTVSTGPSTFTVTVDDAPFTSVEGGDISADVGVPWTGTVATFDHFDYNPQASNYSATIDYPGGTAPGTISSDGSGGWIVTASLTFPDPGSPATTVTISDNAGGSTSIGDGVAINFDPLSLDASNLYLEQGQPYSGTVGVLTDAAGSNSNPGNFSATLIWNGWIYGNLTLTSAGTGTWDLVAPGLAGLPVGTYTESLSVTETDYTVTQSITTDPVNFTAHIISPSVYASGGYISATVGQSWSGTLANVTDDDPYDQPNIYDTASTNYGDGSAPTDSQISAGSTSWTVSDTHTFTSLGVFGAYTTIYDSNGNDIAGAGDTANVNLAPISLTTPDAWLTEGQSLSSVVGTLADQAGFYASGNYSGSLTVTNDATSASQTYAVGFSPDGSDDGGYYVEAGGLPALSGGTYTAALQVSESGGDGQTVDASSDFAINVAALPITIQSSTISPIMDVSWSGAVATFTDPDPNASPGNYSVSINYGDGTAASAGTVSSDGSGGWIISDTHTFPSVGVVSPTVTLTDNTVGGVYSTTDSTWVSPAPIYLNASDQQVQMGSQSVILGTLTDTAGAYASGNYTGTISVNNGYPRPLSFIPDGSNDGGFLVQGNVTYGLSVGNYQATVTAAEYIGGMSIDAPPATFNVDVTDSPISAQGQNIGFAAQVPWTGIVATFTQPNPNASAGNYTATISDPSGSWWGDVNSDGNGGWIVTGTFGYSTPGYYSPTVTISDNAGGSTSVTDSVNVNLAAISLNASNLYLAQGESYTGVIGTVTDAAGYYSNPGNYSAALTWADGSTNTDLTFAPDGPGQWDVMASGLPILPGGQGSASLVVTESAGDESNVVTANFAVDTLLAQGVIINATVNTPWYGTIATVSDTDPADQPSNYTASTDYGDSFGGTPTAPSPGVIWQGSNSDWIVTDTHTFVSGGTYSPTTTLTNSLDGTTASANSYASVNLATITVSASDFWPAAGASWVGGMIGTLSDAAGPYAAGNYSGSVSFSDNPGVSYPVSFSPDGNNDGNYSVHFWGTASLSNGWHDATLLVSETSADQTQSIEASSNFGVHVGPDPMYVVNDTPVAMNGTTAQPITGTLLHFTDSDPEAQSSDYYASVDWGDGTTEYSTDLNSSISIQPDPSGVGFDVVASHAYAIGDYSASITVGAGRDFSLSNNINVNIVDAPLTEMSDSPTTISSLEGQPNTMDDTLFHFTDPDPNATLGTFSASITWGDGSSNTTGDNTGDLTLAADPSGGFDVIGTHIFTSPGNFAVYVAVQHNAGASLGASADASLTATIAPITSTFTATPVNNGAIDLEWWLDVDPSTVTNIELDRSTSPTSGFAPVPAAQYLAGDSVSYMDDAPPLAEGTHYYYELQVTDPPYSTCTSPVADAWTAPAAPTLLTATGTGSTQVSLSWQNNSGDALGFQIERTDAYGNQTTTTISGSYAVGATVTYTDDTASPETPYTYQVQTIGDGGLSDPPTVSNAVTLPAAPTVSAVPASSTQIDLTWINNSAIASGWQIFRSTDGTTFSLLATLSNNWATSYADAGLNEGTHYYYRVEAVASSGVSDPGTADTFTDAAVDTLTAAPASTSEIDLSWNLNTIAATAIEVDRSTDGGSIWTTLTNTLPGTAISYDDTGLSENTTYAYQVRAIEGSSNSAYTAPVSMATLAAISGLTATPGSTDGASEIDLAWTLDLDPTTVTAIEVDRSTSSTGPWTTLTNTLDPNTTTYNDTSNLSESTDYFYQVHAITASGASEEVAATDATTAAAVDTLAATAASTSEIDLTWNLNVTDASAIEVDSSTDGGTTWTTLTNSLSGTATSYNDTGLNDNTDYTYQVRAIRPGGNSAYTATADASTIAAVDTITATPITTGEVDLTWNLNLDPATVSALEIDRSSDGGQTYTALTTTLSPSAIIYHDTSASENQNYSYEMRAILAGGGDSSFSEAAIASTAPIQGLSYTSDTADVTLSWTNISTSATAIEVDRSDDGGTTWTTLTNTLYGSATGYTDSGLSANTEYFYRVQAVEPAGPAGYTDSLDTWTLPAAPSAVTVTSVTPTEVDLSWTDNASGGAPYYIERSDDGGADYSIIDMTDPGATTYADTSVQDGSDVMYKVAAASGDGLYMNESSPTQTSYVPIIAPSGLIATPNGQNEIDLSWTNTSQNNDEYFIERSTDGLNFSFVGSVQYADDTEYQDTDSGNNLNPGTRYFYRVIAASSQNNDVTSAPSNIASAATAPSIGISGNSSTGEGATYTLTRSIQYATGAPDPITGWTLNWGDGNTQSITGDPTSFTHVYPDAGNYTITAATADGSFTGTQDVAVGYVPATFTVTNGDAVITNGDTSAAIVLGDTISPVVTVQDPGGHHVLDWYINWGDGDAETIAGTESSTSVPSDDVLNLGPHTYAGFGYFPVSISAETDDGFYETGFQQQVLYNSNPDVSPPDNAFNVSCTTMNNNPSNADGTFDASLSASGISSAAGSAQINWGDGSSPETIAVSGGALTDTHHYVLPGFYPITVTAATDGNPADDQVSRTSTYVIPYQTNYTPPAEQVVAYGQSLNMNMAYTGMPTGPTNYGPVAMVDWGDGTGEHTYNGSGDNINLTLDHTPLPGGDTVSVQYFDPWGAGFGGYGYERDKNFTLDVWGTVIGDGSNTDLLTASSDGTQNLEPVTVYFPHPDGEALDLTLTTSDAADDDLWPASGDTSGTPLLGGPAQTQSYSFSVGPDDPDYVQFFVGATKGNTTYDVLSYSISGQADNTNSTTDFESEQTAGVFGATGATGNDYENAKSLLLATISLDGDPPNTDPGANGQAMPYNWLVGQMVNLTANVTGPAQLINKVIYQWDIPGNHLGGYAETENSAKTQDAEEYGFATTNAQGITKVPLKFFWVSTSYDPSQAAGPDQDTVQFSAESWSNRTQTATASINFNLFSPVSTTTVVPGVTSLGVFGDPKGGLAVYNLGLNGDPAKKNSPNVGILFGAQVSQPKPLGAAGPFAAGHFRFVQLITPKNDFRLTAAGGGFDKAESIIYDKQGLDSGLPYPEGAGPPGTPGSWTKTPFDDAVLKEWSTDNGVKYSFDSPGIAPVGEQTDFAGKESWRLSFNFTLAMAFFDMSFQTYLMYLPPGNDSAWVPLVVLPWSFTASGGLKAPKDLPAQDGAGAFPANPWMYFEGKPQIPANFERAKIEPEWSVLVTAADLGPKGL